MAKIAYWVGNTDNKLPLLDSRRNRIFVSRGFIDANDFSSVFFPYISGFSGHLYPGPCGLFKGDTFGIFYYIRLSLHPNEIGGHHIIFRCNPLLEHMNILIHHFLLKICFVLGNLNCAQNQECLPVTKISEGGK